MAENTAVALYERNRWTQATELTPAIQSPYVLDSQIGVWRRLDGREPVSYSDGDAVEGRIAQAIRSVSDIGADSDELLRYITDWPTLYHLSPERNNLLRPFRHLLQGRILEVGSGCGAITRFLGETGSQVVALEGSLRRASITAERCGGLGNVSLVCDSIGDYTAAEPFNWITLVGVLEYANRYHPKPEPTLSLLRKCRELLSDTGVLLIAIENRMGLKYFAGAPEDHTGQIFQGLSDAYLDNGVQTFGKKELEQLLDAAGLKAQQFYYPFPDYKLPKLILPQSAFESKPERVLDLLQRSALGYDQACGYDRLFSERGAWSAVLRNGFPDLLANSFLILASPNKRKAPQVGKRILAYTYSTYRRRCFQKENLLVGNVGRLTVRRQNLHETLPPVVGEDRRQELRDEPFLPGSLWANELYRLLDLPGWKFDTIVEWFRPYSSFLLKHAAHGPDGLVVPPQFFDCTPFNIVRLPSGDFEPFDLEWIAGGPVALDFVLFRALLYTLNDSVSVAQPGETLDLGVLSLTIRLINTVGLAISDQRLEELWQMEEAQQKWVVGSHASLSRSYWRDARLSPRLENIRNELKSRNDTAESLSAQLQAQEHEARNRADSLQQEARSRTNDLEQAIEARNREIDSLTTQLQSRQQEARSRTNDLEQAIEARNREIDSLTTRLQSQQQAARSRTDYLEHALGERSKEGVALNRHVVTLSQSVAELTAGASHRETVIEGFRTQARELHQALGERDHLAGDLKDRAAVLSQRLSTAKMQHENFAKTLRDAEARLAEHKRQIIELEYQLTEKFEKCQRLQVAVDERDRDLATVREEVGLQCRKVEALIRSRSWRCTAPLRSAIRGLFYLVDAHPVTPATINSPTSRAVAALLCRFPQRRRAHKVMKASRLFDAKYYCSRYPDVEASGVLPLSHYILWGTAEGRDPHPLFNTRFYLEHNPDVAAQGCNPLAHYIENGAAEGRDPHPLFNTRFYLEHNPDVAAQGCNPLAHYIENGAAEGRDPHPLFNTRFYLEHNPDVAAQGCNPLAHYVQYGADEGRWANLWFDPQWYCREYAEVRQSGLDPLVHYLTTGAAEGRNPHPFFDAAWYLEANPDVKGCGVAPLAHYLLYGAQEGRATRSDPTRDFSDGLPATDYNAEVEEVRELFAAEYYVDQCSEVHLNGDQLCQHYLTVGAREGKNPHPLFDTSFYLNKNPDVAQSGTNPLVHFVRNGAAEGRDPHPLFNTRFYLEHNPDVAAQGCNPLAHYVQYGADEGRWANLWFDPQWYCREYAEVRQSGLDPLVHYLTTGAAEGRNPHPFFDAAWYLEANPDVKGCGVAPLAHYLLYGAQEGRATRSDPTRDFSDGLPATDYNAEVEEVRELFAAEYYVDQCSEVHLNGDQLCQHYLTVGAREGKNPHPLFDTSFYLNKNPDVAQSGTNPLVHFVRNGAAEGRDPHPLFNTRFYLEHNPDVAAQGCNPLAHYIRHGYAEGRQPNTMFDSRYYLDRYPDVVATHVNPLVHFVRWGSSEQRDPHPMFSTKFYLEQHPELAKHNINPLRHYLELDATRASVPVTPAVLAAHPQPKQLGNKFTVRNVGPSSRPFAEVNTIFVVTHVPLHAPRAGNEYRISRMLEYLQRKGYRVVLLLSPLPGEELSDEEFLGLAERFPYSILSNRDGEVLYSMRDGGSVLDSLNGTNPENLALRLKEDAIIDERACHILSHDRTFCHDPLAHVALRVHSALGQCVVMAEYIFMTRFLPLITSPALKIVDTHDVFSTKAEKVVKFGVHDSFNLKMGEERERLLRADLVLAIQSSERDELAVMVPERKVITIGVDFNVVNTAPPAGYKILYLASDNAMNVKGLRDFLRFSWPTIGSKVPEAEFLVAGRVARHGFAGDPRVKFLGPVGEIDSCYQQARVVVNPAVAGTGLKIKTLEALSRLRPIVTWPSGIDGIEPDLANLCLVADNWYLFTQAVIRTLTDPAATWFSPTQESIIQRFLSPDRVYAPICSAVEDFLTNSRLTAKANF